MKKLLLLTLITVSPVPVYGMLSRFARPKAALCSVIGLEIGAAMYFEHQTNKEFENQRNEYGRKIIDRWLKREEPRTDEEEDHICTLWKKRGKGYGEPLESFEQFIGTLPITRQRIEPTLLNGPHPADFVRSTQFDAIVSDDTKSTFLAPSHYRFVPPHKAEELRKFVHQVRPGSEPIEFIVTDTEKGDGTKAPKSGLRVSGFFSPLLNWKKKPLFLSAVILIDEEWHKTHSKKEEQEFSIQHEIGHLDFYERYGLGEHTKDGFSEELYCDKYTQQYEGGIKYFLRKLSILKGEDSITTCSGPNAKKEIIEGATALTDDEIINRIQNMSQEDVIELERVLKKSCPWHESHPHHVTRIWCLMQWQREKEKQELQRCQRLARLRDLGSPF